MVFGHHPAAHVFAAYADELVVFATYSFLWPAIGLTRSLFLKELYQRNFKVVVDVVS